MGTEVELSCNSLRLQLENEKNSLSKIDENIKKNQSARRYQESYFNNSSEANRGGAKLGRNNFQDSRNFNKLDEERNVKRKQETKTVFSRLSSRKEDNQPDEDEFENKRPRISSQVTRDLPTKQEVMKAQQSDEVSKGRNRRMFNSLLGTLQKFKQEEITLKTKEDKKAQVEKKIEQQAIQQRETEKKDRINLFQERDRKKATIKALEIKMARLEEFERWESNQKLLCNHILTKGKPHVFWLPKKMNERASEKLENSRKHHEKTLDKKRKDLQKELECIEEKCFRNVKGYQQRSNVSNSLGTNLRDDDTSIENLGDKEIKMEDEQTGDKENEKKDYKHRGKSGRRSESEGMRTKVEHNSDEDMETDVPLEVGRTDQNGSVSPKLHENGEAQSEIGHKENVIDQSTEDVNMSHNTDHVTEDDNVSPAHTLPSPAHSPPSPVQTIPSPVHNIPSPVHNIPSPDHTPSTPHSMSDRLAEIVKK